MSTSAITEFTGEYRFLSNFWPCPVTLGTVTYPSAEHAYQASKTLDQGARLAIAGLETPGRAKRAGQKLQLRPDWEGAKKRVMLLTVLVKFAENAELGKRLAATGDAVLVEGNTWGDTYWGAVRYQGYRERETVPVWRGGDPRPEAWLAGQNWLGRILMMVRDVVRQDA